MFTYLRQLAARLLHGGSPLPPFNPPTDPYAAVREPRPARPAGRSSAVAVEEPTPADAVNAVGRHRLIVLALLGTAALLATSNVRAGSDAQANEKPFVSGGKIDIQLSGGDYSIVPASDNRIRVTLTGDAGSTKVDLGTNGSQATVKVSNTPRNNFKATIEVPKVSDLTLHLTGGDLSIAGITGNKDVNATAGDLSVAVPDPNEYGSVELSVKAGDIDAHPFGGSKSGLLQTFTWSGKGKYMLHVRLGAGDLKINGR